MGAASEPIDKARAGIDRPQSSIYKKEVDEVWTLRSVLLLILGCRWTTAKINVISITPLSAREGGQEASVHRLLGRQAANESNFARLRSTKGYP